MGKSGCTPEPAEGILGWPAIGSRVARAAFNGARTGGPNWLEIRSYKSASEIKVFDPSR